MRKNFPAFAGACLEQDTSGGLIDREIGRGPDGNSTMACGSGGFHKRYLALVEAFQSPQREISGFAKGTSPRRRRPKRKQRFFSQEDGNCRLRDIRP